MNYFTAGGALPSQPAFFFFLSPFSKQQAINGPCLLFIHSRTNSPALRDPSWPHGHKQQNLLYQGCYCQIDAQAFFFFFPFFLFYLHTGVCTQLYSRQSCNVFQAWTRCSGDVNTVSPLAVWAAVEWIWKRGSKSVCPQMVCLHTGTICCSSCATWNPDLLFEFQQGKGKRWLCNHLHQGNGQKQNTPFIFPLPLAGQSEPLKWRSFNQRLNDEWHHFPAKTKTMCIHESHGSRMIVSCFLSSPSHQGSSDSSHMGN